jgi:hypothetical protein
MSDELPLRNAAAAYLKQQFENATMRAPRPKSPPKEDEKV